MVSSKTEDPGMKTFSSIIKRSLALILAAGCIASLCACSKPNSGRSAHSVTANSHREINEPDACCVYIRDTFDLDLFEYCAYARMGSKNSASEDYVEIRFEVKTGKEDELQEYLKESLGDGEEYANDNIPAYQDHEYALEMKTMEPVRHFVKFKQGTVAKSRGTNFYLAQDGDRLYLFIFG